MHTSNFFNNPMFYPTSLARAYHANAIIIEIDALSDKDYQSFQRHSNDHN